MEPIARRVPGLCRGDPLPPLETSAAVRRKIRGNILPAGERARGQTDGRANTSNTQKISAETAKPPREYLWIRCAATRKETLSQALQGHVERHEGGAVR